MDILSFDRVPKNTRHWNVLDLHVGGTLGILSFLGGTLVEPLIDIIDYRLFSIVNAEIMHT